MHIKIAILIPYYNEEKNLYYFIKEWENFSNQNKELNKNLFFFFFDDGSTDNSTKTIKKNVKRIKYRIVRKKNSGHGDTCKFGYQYIVKRFQNFDYILQIDSDNQCDPKYLLKFYDLIDKEKNPFIFGYRKVRKDGNLRFINSRVMSFIFFLKKFLYIKDLNTPYRIMRINELKKVFKIINTTKKYNNIMLFNCLLSYVILKNYKIKWVNIIFRKRYFGTSKYNFSKMLSLFLNLIFKV
jgi:dolichol-phosphate mannosyltransferase|tara:strand:- start:11019 stop:11735 length:717 start_codon:yes stop_codon:yes gene_type:complete